MKIAIVHDFLKYYGGAERVVEALHDIWPDAPVYTSFVDYQSLGPHAYRLKKWNIIESPFGSTWFMKKFHSPLRFLAPLVWNQFDFSEFDIVISSSGWYISKGIKTKKPTVHLCYLHHPPRHLYGYQTAMDWQKYWPVRLYGNIINHFLRMYDFDTAQKVDYFIANSEEVKRRIKKFYRKESTVIYPPVNSRITRMVSESTRIKHSRLFESKFVPFENYYLIVSRLARAKHIDLVIKACQKLNAPLVIVGKGREEDYLKSLVKTGHASSIRFLGEVSDEQLPSIYSNAKALIFPSEDEEFGIVPVESMGYGTPVISYQSGGMIETIIEGETGIFFNRLTVESLSNAIKDFEIFYNKNKDKIKEACYKRAKNYSSEVFEKKMREIVQSVVK